MAFSVENTFTNFSGIFPDAVGVNASGAGATDGTEFVKAMTDNWLFGPQQALLDRAGLTPDEVVESASASQTIEAIKKGFNVGPGKVEMFHFNDAFATLGYRVLPLNGQGVLRATYPELDAITYVGDANNPTAAAYYRADDAAGTIRNIVGVYLILPESRGYAPRGLDTAASIDPDGASRTLGDNQGDTFQNWQLGSTEDLTGARNYWARIGQRDLRNTGSATANYGIMEATTTFQGVTNMLKAVDDGTNGAPRTGSETRMTNFSVNFGVGY